MTELEKAEAQMWSKDDVEENYNDFKLRKRRQQGLSNFGNINYSQIQAIQGKKGFQTLEEQAQLDDFKEIIAQITGKDVNEITDEYLNDETNTRFISDLFSTNLSTVQAGMYGLNKEGMDLGLAEELWHKNQQNAFSQLSQDIQLANTELQQTESLLSSFNLDDLGQNTAQSWEAVAKAVGLTQTAFKKFVFWFKCNFFNKRTT